MKHYETLYIISPELGDEDYKAVVAKHKDLIEKEKGVIVKLDEWGKRRLAYQLRKFDQGFYVLMDYCGGAGITAEVAMTLKLDDKVLKYQTVKLGDNVDPETLIENEKVPLGSIAPPGAQRLITSIFFLTKDAVGEKVACQTKRPESGEKPDPEALKIGCF